MRILSLDGGGIRGVLTARLLERLEERCPGFLDHVDLIAGTSTGGIQALKLASGGEPANLVRLYQERGTEIFRSRDWIDALPRGARIGLWGIVLAGAAAFFCLSFLGLSTAGLVVLLASWGVAALACASAKVDELFRSDFSPGHLEAVLKEELGSETRLRDLKKAVLVPTFDMRSWNTRFFDNLPGNHRDLDRALWEVARCTSAAPTYWPSHWWCLDGGLFANNPADSAVAAAIRHLRQKKLFEDPDLQGLGPEQAEFKATCRAVGEISVLSLGTGEVPHSAPKDPSHDAGILQVLPTLLNVTMDGAVKASAFRAQQVLGVRHVRIQPRLPSAIDLADVRSVPDLLSVADLVDLDRAVRLIRDHWLPKAT